MSQANQKEHVMRRTTLILGSFVSILVIALAVWMSTVSSVKH